MTHRTDMPTPGEALREIAGSPDWWRTVLGEYPTGVTLITALDENGEVLAMVVGSFAAVSEDPPLVSFMPATNSGTYPVIAKSGRFVASVLGASHEDLCRAFSKKLPDRFDHGTWETTASGIPRLKDAVAWFDGLIVDEHAAGDHTIVIGAVTDFGVGGTNAGLPLLYLRGGYGSFTVPSLTFDVQGFTRQLRMVEEIREEVVNFAEELDIECEVCGLAQDSVVVLHAMNVRGGFDPSARPTGSAFHFAAPLAPTFAAWGSVDVQKAWLENARHAFGSIDRAGLMNLLETIRERGYGVWRTPEIGNEIDRLVDSSGEGRLDPTSLWEAVSRDVAASSGPGLPGDASSVQIPLFAQDGSVGLVLVISRFDDALSSLGRSGFESRLLKLSTDLSHRLAIVHPD